MNSTLQMIKLSGALEMAAVMGRHLLVLDNKPWKGCGGGIS